MIKNLYPHFIDWSAAGSVYLYSDPHFGDADSYAFRGLLADGKTVEDLDKMQIDNINAVAHKCDTLVILGDVGDLECVKRLKAGRKILIMGNHDEGSKNNYSKDKDPKLFDEVYTGALLIADNIMLSHEPIDFKYALDIHGHDHGLSDFRKYVKTPVGDPMTEYMKAAKKNGLNKICVIAELTGYKPISLAKIINAGLPAIADDIHRTTINAAAERKRKKKK